MVTVPESHPELETERGHLAQTVQSIQDALQRLESPSGAGIDAAANRAADETRRQRAAEFADSLDISSPSPVLSWKSSVYELYVRGQPGPQTSRNARGQPVQASVVLKRAFVIESRELRHMQDDFDLRPDAAQAGRLGELMHRRWGVENRNFWVRDGLFAKTTDV